MEKFEKKKKMPMITTYSSDNEVDLDDSPEEKSETLEFPKSYAEWKKSKKTKNGVKQNGKVARVRSDGSYEPLGDISSSEDESCGFDENLNMINLYNHVKESRSKVKNGVSIKKKKSNVSKFLLFCLVKNDHYESLNDSWSFSEICRMCRSLWLKNSDVEREDLEENIEQRKSQYQDILYQIKLCLTNSPKSQAASFLQTSKEDIADRTEVPESLPVPPPEPQEPTQDSIPLRLQNLAGTASVYHAQPSVNKKSFVTKGRHSIFAYTRNIFENSNSILEYVDPSLRSNKSALNSTIDLDESFSSSDNSSDKSDDNSPEKCVCCGLRDCVNDPRWQGANYCSVECLMEHCRREFQLWVKERQKECNGNNKEAGDDTCDSSDAADEVVDYLTSLANKEDQNMNDEMMTTEVESITHLKMDQNTAPVNYQSERGIYSPPIIQTSLSLNSR